MGSKDTGGTQGWNMLGENKWKSYNCVVSDHDACWYTWLIAQDQVTLQEVVR